MSLSALTHARAKTLPTVSGIRLSFDFNGKRAGEYPKSAEIERRVRRLFADLYVTFGEDAFTYQATDIELAYVTDTEGNTSPYHVDVAIIVESQPCSLAEMAMFARDLTLSVERLGESYKGWQGHIHTTLEIDAF